MTGLISRVLLACGAMLAGALGGWLVGGSARAAWVGTVLGGAAAVGVIVSVDALRLRRLADWLRGPQEGHAPRHTGMAGELAYRFERALRARERLLEEERARMQQFLEAIEASPNGVMLLDPQGRVEWCNSMSAQHFGLDPRRDRQQRVTNLVRAPAFVDYLQAGRFDEAVTFVAPNGRDTLSVLGRPYGEGMTLVLSQNVTERERTDAMRRDFVANVSHEIRTPLTVLAGFVETLATLPLQQAERSRVLELMQQQTDRMQALVSDLLALAQLEGGAAPPADRWHPVRELLAHVEVDAGTLSAGRHTLSFDCNDDAEIAGSEQELLSAIGNVVSNAVRYTPAGGSVKVSWFTREDGSGVVSVTDSGIGIAREHLPRLTERFYRVDGSRSRETGGTGLGLSIVKHVLQRHGGSIEIDSEPGRGSRFRLLFPSNRVRPSQATSSVPQAATGSPSSAAG